MDEPRGKNARSSPESASLPNPTEDHTSGEEASPRRARASAPTTATAFDPASVDNSVELDSISQSRERNAQTPHVAVRVPRSQRRGLFARLTILAEVKDPYQYSYTTKWFIVFLVAYAAAAAPMGSAILFRT